MSTITVTDAAKAYHEAKRAYCLALGDTSEVPWDEASAAQRESVKHRVRMMLEKNERGQPAHIGAPHHVHAQWLRQKSIDGWKRGAYDLAKKRHPGVGVSYDDLPAEHRAKDQLFFSIMKGLMSKHEIVDG